MKITAIRTVIVHAGDRNWVLVRVETDQAGLYGWGEGTLEWKTRAAWRISPPCCWAEIPSTSPICSN